NSKKINTKSTKMKNFGGKGEVLLFESHLILYSSSEDKLGNFCVREYGKSLGDSRIIFILTLYERLCIMNDEGIRDGL
ncbi:MAG: hypothetical protein AB1567_09030, partial [bacterium]